MAGVRVRTRFTPWMTFDLAGRRVRDERGAPAGDSLLVRILQPAVATDTGVPLVDDAAVYAPAGVPGDWRPWAAALAAITVLGLTLGFRALRR